jgi:NADH-quinone oxidoreductase subunit M
MIAGILGAFASMDLFFFYFFHELALVPTFIMIGVWGRGQNRNYATYKITLYLSLGALLALIGLIGVYVQTGAESFSIPDLIAKVQESPIAESAQQWIFPLLMFGFGILVSLWPFHTWAPLGYGAAPTATAMLHAGVVKKFGLYGLIRVAIPMAPVGAQSWLGVLAWLALANLLYCGLVAVRQKDLNLLIGNSSVAHMGFIFLGIASLNVIGLTGAVLVMIAHGLLAALAFGLSGHLYRQTGSLDMSRMGGLLRQMPLAGSALLMVLFAGCGLPGFANFAGEMTIFFAAWAAGLKVVTVIAAWSALVIGGLYMMRAIRNILHGPRGDDWAKASDVSPLIATALGLLLAALLVFGFAPWLLTNGIEDEVKKSVLLAKPSAAASQAQATEAAGR